MSLNSGLNPAEPVGGCQQRGGINEMGEQLLRLFEPGMDAVMTRMGPLLTSRDIIAALLSRASR